VVSALISFHLISTLPMTEIVTTFSCEYHFQYVERRYSGFVALSFVVKAIPHGSSISGINELNEGKENC
jgi:hypothetical protein